MVWVVKTPTILFNNGSNIHLFLPENADFELGFDQVMTKAEQLSRKLKDKLIVHSTQNMVDRIETGLKKDLKGYFQEAVIHQFSKQEYDQINATDSDLFLIVSSRKSNLSYDKHYEKFTMRLITKYSKPNIVFIYPQQV